MPSGVIVGYDPGGKGCHGVAQLRFADGVVTSASTSTLDTTEAVVRLLETMPALDALGVDTLTCWSTGPAGWRPADRWLRRQYPAVRNSVMSPNGLYGSMALNGMAVLLAARQRFPQVVITETHPKVLYWHLHNKRYDYERAKALMDGELVASCGTPVAPANSHEWDAALSALAAFMGVRGRWSRDLHQRPSEQGERLIMPCGRTHFFWP